MRQKQTLTTHSRTFILFTNFRNRNARHCLSQHLLCTVVSRGLGIHQFLYYTKLRYSWQHCLQNVQFQNAITSTSKNSPISEQDVSFDARSSQKRKKKVWSQSRKRSSFSIVKSTVETLYPPPMGFQRQYKCLQGMEVIFCLEIRSLTLMT